MAFTAPRYDLLSHCKFVSFRSSLTNDNKQWMTHGTFTRYSSLCVQFCVYLCILCIVYFLEMSWQSSRHNKKQKKKDPSKNKHKKKQPQNNYSYKNRDLFKTLPGNLISTYIVHPEISWKQKVGDNSMNMFSFLCPYLATGNPKFHQMEWHATMEVSRGSTIYDHGVQLNRNWIQSARGISECFKILWVLFVNQAFHCCFERNALFCNNLDKNNIQRTNVSPPPCEVGSCHCPLNNILGQFKES